MEFCWYTSVIGALAAIFGLIVFLKEKQRKTMYMLMVYLVISIVNIVIYLYKPSITADHIWAARRWVGVCIPFVIIFAAYGFTKVGSAIKNKKAGKCVGAVLAAATFAFLIYQSSPFIFKSMLKDLDVQYDAVAQEMDDSAVYFTDNEEIAAVFKYVYDKNVYMLKKDNAEGLKKYIEKNGSILYIGDCEKTWIAKNMFDFDVEKLSDNTICGEFLERGWGEFPRETYERFYSADIYEVSLAENEHVKIYDKPSESFEIVNGETTGSGGIASSESDGIVMYGPYANLEKGNYKVVINIKAVDGADISGKCSVSAGGNKFAEQAFGSQENIEMEFALNEYTSGIEFVVEAVNSGSFVCESVEIAKIDG